MEKALCNFGQAGTGNQLTNLKQNVYLFMILSNLPNLTFALQKLKLEMLRFKPIAYRIRQP